MLSTVGTVVQRRDGARWLRDSDDDDDESSRHADERDQTTGRDVSSCKS